MNSNVTDLKGGRLLCILPRAHILLATPLSYSDQYFWLSFGSAEVKSVNLRLDVYFDSLLIQNLY